MEEKKGRTSKDYSLLMLADPRHAGDGGSRGHPDGYTRVATKKELVHRIVEELNGNCPWDWNAR